MGGRLGGVGGRVGAAQGAACLLRRPAGRPCDAVLRRCALPAPPACLPLPLLHSSSPLRPAPQLNKKSKEGHALGLGGADSPPTVLAGLPEELLANGSEFGALC